MKPQPKVVICGSFRKGEAELKKLYLELETNGCRILAPLSLNFERPEANYVKLSSERNFSVKDLERSYLRAIEECDFIWLHAPEGYIGLSGAFELGFSYNLDKPIYCRTNLQDVMLASFVTPVSSVFESLLNWSGNSNNNL